MLAVCGNSVSQIKNASQTQQKDKTELYLSMKRSGCYGRCPIYNLTVQPNGNIIFEDKDYTETIGKAESKLSEDKRNQLITEIEKANFFSLENAYNSDSKNCPNFATDSSDVTIYVKLDGKEKTINHYLGCFEDEKPKDNTLINKPQDLSEIIYPQNLYNLENKIDERVETKRWIGERK